MSAIYRPGTWCDVCVLPDGRIAFVRVQATVATAGGPERHSVVCEIDGNEAWTVDVKVASLFLRCAALADGTVAAIVKANDPQGSALLVLRGVVKNLGATAGNNPVAITATHAYIVTGPAVAHRVRFDDGFSEPVPLLWTSQGIRDVLPAGGGSYIVVSADGTYASVVRGYNFGEYQTRGDLTVGQHGNGIGVLTEVLNDKGKPVDYFFVARTGPVNYGVHGAQSGPRIAVCAYTEGGSYYQEFAPPYPAAPVVTPPAPTVPPPAPKPEPTPVSIPNQLSTVQRVRAKYPTPLGTSHPLFLIDVAQATGAKLLKKDGGTHVTLPNGVNVSQDILVFSNGAECYDILGDGEGAATPGWGAKGAIAGTYIDVTGFAVPGAPQPPAQPPVTPSTPGVDLTPLQNELAALAARNALLEARVLAIESKPAAHSGDAVEVTGSVSLSDAYGRKRLTWTGKIL